MSAKGAGKDRSVQKTADLFELSKSPPPIGIRYKLAPEWIGTVKRVYLRGGEKIYKADKPEDIRLTHAWTTKPRGIKGAVPVLQAARFSNESYAEREAPIFRRNLPSTQEIAAMTASDLKRAFGNQHGFSDAHGAGDRLAWTEMWTWFAFESPREIRFLHVFAHLRGNPGKGDPETNILLIREGLFHPADPASDEQRKKFKTAEEIEAIEEAKRQSELAKFPEPLRNMLDVRDRPNDPELAAYKKAISAVRAAPDERLVEQAVVALGDDNSITVSGVSENITSDNLADVIAASHEHILKQHPELRTRQEAESAK